MLEFVHDRKLRNLVPVDMVKEMSESELIAEMVSMRKEKAEKVAEEREILIKDLDFNSYNYGVAEGMSAAFTQVLVAISTLKNRPQSNYIKDAVVSALLETYVHKDTGIELTDEEYRVHEKDPIDNVVNKMEYLFGNEMQLLD